MRQKLSILLFTIAGMFGVLGITESHSHVWLFVVFWWTALAMGIVAAGYWTLGPGVFLKRHDGQVHPIGLITLGPYHLMNWIAFKIFFGFKQEAAFHQIVPNVYLGRQLTERDLRKSPVRWQGVLDLTAELTECKTLRILTDYRNIQVLDRTAPTIDQIRVAVWWIKEVKTRGPVLVHCAFGYGRSAMVVMAFLLESGVAKSVEDAHELVRKQRPRIRLNRDQLKTLKQLWPHSESIR